MLTRHQIADNPQTTPTWAAACGLLLFTSTIAIYCHYSVQKLTTDVTIQQRMEAECIRKRLAARLHPDLLRELTAFPRFLEGKERIGKGHIPHCY